MNFYTISNSVSLTNQRDYEKKEDFKHIQNIDRNIFESQINQVLNVELVWTPI